MVLRQCFGSLLLAALLLPSCKRVERKEQGKHSTETSPPVVNSSVGDGVRGEKKEAESIGAAATELNQAMARVVLEQWVSAQNSASFDDYSKNYALRFSGIKRVGARSFRMDRTQWLADREQMFKSKPRVQISNLEITLSGGAALLHFEQHWASKNYEDRGRKVMTLVMEENGPKIAREEMLSSHVLGKVERSGPSSLFLVHRLDRTSYAIVGDDATTKEPELHQVTGGYEVLGPADLTAKSEFHAWKGRQIRVFDGAGNICNTVTGEVQALGRALPHFGMPAQWSEEKLSQRDRTWAIFSLSSPQYAVEIRPTGSDCGEPVLAQVIADTAPDFASEFDDGGLYQAAFEAFLKTAQVQKIQKEYKLERTSAEEKDWTEVSMVRKTVQLFEFRKTEKRYAWVSLHTGDGCGGWEGGDAMLFEIVSTERPSFKALTLEGGERYPLGRLTALLDENGDGQLEFVHHASIGSEYSLFEGGNRQIKTVHFSDWDCPC